MKNKINFETLSTDHLEMLLKNTRGPEDAKAIREELKKRQAGRRDTGTLPLPLFSAGEAT